MNNILNIFDPIIFPIAISLFPFIAAVTLVTSSGKLVPIASIVNPIIFSLTLNCLAIIKALSTVKSPPIFNPIIPNIINIMFFMMNLKQQVWQALKLLSSGIMRESLFYAAARWIAGRNLPEVWSVKVCTGLHIWLCRCG